MKKFKNLQIGDIIYKCNFKRNDITKYEVLNNEPSRYVGQLFLSLQRINEQTRSYSEYVNEQINVFEENSNEPCRGFIGSDKETLWCSDKTTVLNKFLEYKKNVMDLLREQQNNIAERL